MEYSVIISLITLIALEVVLGIDNVIFISIIAGKLPVDQQKKARRMGMILAGVLRLGLLALISVILKLDKDLFEAFGKSFSAKELILIVGGLFLLYKSAKEIYHKMEGEEGDVSRNIKVHSYAQVILQILIMDLVFSIDSIITAVGLVREIWIMYVAVIVAVTVMMIAAEPISSFVNKHPAFKILALSFLMIIGFALVSEGLGVEIPKGYIYFSMAFAFLVELAQMRMSKKASKSPPVNTREHYSEGEDKLPKGML